MRGERAIFITPAIKHTQCHAGLDPASSPILDSPFRGNDGFDKNCCRINNQNIFICLFPLLCCIFPVTLAYASGGGTEGGHEGPGLVNFAWKLLNFLVMAGVIYWLTAKKVKEFFTGRREGIKTSLAEAVAAREDAEKKFREYAVRLDRATGEIDETTRMIQDQGLAEKERIIAEARKTAEKMKEDTKALMEQEFNKASHQLRIEAVRLSAQMAAGLLQKNIRVEDHEAMVLDYIENVVRKD